MATTERVNGALGRMSMEQTSSPGMARFFQFHHLTSFWNDSVNQVGSQTFSVQNTGGGVLAGSAIVAAPFSITNGSYSLGAGLSQLITVQFSPNTSGAVTNVVTFTVTGGNGTNAMVYGIGSAIPSPTVFCDQRQCIRCKSESGRLANIRWHRGCAFGDRIQCIDLPMELCVNGGLPWFSGVRALSRRNFSYGTNTIGNTYVWTLSVSNSQGSAQSQFALNVLAPPVHHQALLLRRKVVWSRHLLLLVQMERPFISIS